MIEQAPPLAVTAANVPPRPKSSNYPEEFVHLVAGRSRQVLGNLFGLSNFGVNMTTLEPGSGSSIMHRHAKQDEFIFILEGIAVLVTDRGEMEITAGMCAGFPAAGLAHNLENRSNEKVVYLEIGDRTPGDTVTYPQADLVAESAPEGGWVFKHKDGTPY